ncbi:ATP-binding protein [Sporolactobacillus kofuensis]|uniref:histidine kinase n=1 Tax=Sporolactobacillus kofuensis TaxID=269672 RepID=A0ABW1WET6_9BACL|nr:ATP-binding protein [Sporolactobacillus kofuensis]MCO7176700.1 ATP-binding protein [Sporolactobacillus kofuensis]
MTENSKSTAFDFKQMIEQTIDAIVLISHGKIVYSNRAANQLLSFDERTPLNGLTMGLFLDPLDLPIFSDHLNEIRSGQKNAVTFPLSIHSSTNKKIPVEFTCQPFRDQEQCMAQLTIRDISERKAVEESMRQSEKLSVIGELSAGILHEIRNPLTSIKGFLQLMEASSEVHTDYMEIIMREIEQIERITNELLYFTKPNRERFTQFDLVEIAQETMTLFEGQALKQQVAIKLTSSNHHHFIVGDRTQLKQVFVNLVKNALEATAADGKITIDLSSSAHHEHISIRDTGEGMPKQVFENLGKSFFTTKQTGTGLGLMVTYSIIKNHKGKVIVTSEEHQGTTFHVIFPSINR